MALLNGLLAFVVTTLISVVSTAHAAKEVFEKRHVVPLDWFESQKPDPELVLAVRIGLKQQNVDRLEEFLNSTSHPDSTLYGQYWTPRKVAQTFAPAPETIQTVENWLVDSGIAGERLTLARSKGWIQFNATVRQVEHLIGAEYKVYRHQTGAEQVACPSYSIPDRVYSHIEIIMPTLLFAHGPGSSTRRTIRGRASPNALSPARLHSLGSPTSDSLPKLKGKVTHGLVASNGLEHCDENMTPDCLRALYNIKYAPVATKNNSFAIVEYTPQAFLPADLALFFDTFSRYQDTKMPSLVPIDGGVVQTTDVSFDFNGESSLDLEYGMTLANPQPVTLYQVGDLVQGATFNHLLDALDGSFCTFEGGDDPKADGAYPDPAPGGFDERESCGISKPANVISTSFSFDEGDASPAYLRRQCTEYGKLGLLGVTILYSSGDRGVAGENDICLFPNGTGSTNAPVFVPSFPATCPFVTSVGATQVNPGAKVTAPESACEQIIFSGGGFSNVFAMPEYQTAAQKSFFAYHKPPYTATQYNDSQTVRGYPDISANGANYIIAVDGSFARVFGTSASTPVVGAMMTLVNDARLARGKGPVGFINPAIYSPRFRSAFNDITAGTNPGCGTLGFSAVSGWDPVTGVGTPNLEKLIEKWITLP